jgi:hypothetical protein
MNRIVLMTSGATAGEDSRISAFDATNKKLTLAVALSAIPLTGDTFEIVENFTYDEIEDAITAAENAAKKAFLNPTVDATLTLADATYEYDVPSGIDYINDIYVAHDVAGFYDLELPQRWWKLLDVGGVPKLVLLNDSILSYSGKAIRLEGQKHPTSLTTESSTIDSDEQFMVDYVAWWLGQQKPLALDDPDGWRQRLLLWQSSIAEAVSKRGRKPNPNARRVPGR